jgi:hypothetical protein
VGFRVRKSFKLAPGVRMTVTPRGVGVSAGPRGAKLSVHSSGRVTQTLSLPGSGISHTKTLGPSGRLSRGSAMPTSPSGPAQPAPPAPGWIAPKWQKQLWTVTIRRPSPADIADVAKLDTRSHHVVAFLETVMHLVPSADLASARRRVEWLWSSGYDPARDPFLNRYMPDLSIVLGLTAEITAALPADRDALGLMLAELRQATGDAANAARESFKRALAARSRPPILRHLGLVERGQCYLAEGKRAMARKDFQKVLAENANYPGLADHLAAVAE